MKFLCDNCKAKYQIPDEKIAGRTLRMKCRKCGHSIIIRGPKSGGAAPAPAARPSAAGRRRSGSGLSSVGPTPRRRGGSGASPRPAPRSSALGAEFRRSASLAPEAAPARPQPEWYVAINDVPVGPVKREEVARKIGTGAVTGSSLCWREGFDDWRPVAEVPELARLLEQRRVPPPRSKPPAAPPKREDSRSNVIPIGGRLGAGAAPESDFEEEDEKTVMAPAPAALLDESVRPPEEAPAKKAPAPAPPPAPAPAAAALKAGGGDGEEKADESDPFGLAIGEPLAAGAAPAAPPTPAPQLTPPPAAPAPAAAPATEERRRGLPVGAWIAIVGAGCFGIALAVVVGGKLVGGDGEEVAQGPAAQVEPEVEPEVEAPVDLEMPEEAPEVEPEAEAEGEEPEGEAPAAENGNETPTRSRSTTMRATSTAMSTTTMSATSMLTAEQQRRLAALTMSGSDEAAPGMIDLGGSSSNSSSRMSLDNSAVRRVVTAPSNQRALQRCYELAIRGMGEPPDARLDVDVRVGASGAVTNVSARGQDFGGLKTCVTRAVRRWRFPPSSSGGRAAFPVVFTGR